MRYIKRTLEPVLKAAVDSFPAVVLTGPRQSGKTTLLRHLFGKDFTYLALDVSDNREFAEDDPRGFLNTYSPPVILDEAQVVPDLFPYLRERIDDHREESGQYIITGSQNFQLLEKITESLAGRTAILNLFPLTQSELNNQPDKLLPWNPQASRILVGEESDIWEQLVTGYYPELAVKKETDRQLWLDSYLQTYLERDVRSLSKIGDQARFEDFLRIVAARSGNLLNHSEIAKEMGLAVNTIRAWISVLQASFQVLILHPWHTNINKEMTKTPKLYMTDTGLMCSLLGIESANILQRSEYAGAVFETAVVNEIRKRIAHFGKKQALHFWRTAAGTEVDLLVQNGTRKIAVEVKKTMTPRKKHISSLSNLINDLSDAIEQSYLVHTGTQVRPIGNNITAMPFIAL